MLSRRNIVICGIAIFLLIFLPPLVLIKAEDTTEQIVSQIDDILRENPLKPGEKAQTIKIAEDDRVTLLVLRLVEGVEVKKHYHKAHDEIVFGIKGMGQTMVGERWVDIKSGTLHFNPMGKAHAVRHIGKEPMVVISIFSPAMKEPDRHFVE